MQDSNSSLDVFGHLKFNPRNAKTATFDAFLRLFRVEFPQRGDAFNAPLYILQDLQGPLVISLVESLSDQSLSLSGRTTSVFKFSNNQKAFGWKTSSREVESTLEGDILKTVDVIAEKQEPDMLNHLSKHYLSGDLLSGNTPRPRSISGISGIIGLRTSRVVVISQVAPLTSLTDGKSFVKAWLDVVTCHALLWKHGIKHGDPSLWNVMFDPTSKCGVLTDFDLTDMAWLDRVLGSDQTVTIPFMALDLLCDEYWDGKVSRHYYHELEAFLWILPVVFLAWDQGNLNLCNKFVKNWFTSDCDACWKNKQSFLYRTLADASDLVHGNFKEFASLMRRLCILIKGQYNLRLQEQDELPGANAYGDDSPHNKFSEAMWEAFIGVLSNSGIDVGISKLRTHKPTLDIAQCQELFERMQEIFQCVVRD